MGIGDIYGNQFYFSLDCLGPNDLCRDAQCTLAGILRFRIWCLRNGFPCRLTNLRGRGILDM